MSDGYSTEDIVEEICSLMFLADFTARSPKYMKASGQEKEAADFLVPFGDQLLAFQIKSKTEHKPGSEKSETDFDRIAKRVDTGVEQLKTIVRALRANRITELRNGLDLRIPFSCGDVSTVIGIVVLQLVGEDQLPEGERTAILNGFQRRHGVPAHIFMLDDFREIATELDTLPDFIDYLTVRARLRESGVLSPLARELDFLVVYKTRKDIIDQCLDGSCTHLSVEPGSWDAYVSVNREDINSRNAANRPSYVIDNIIQRIRGSVGYAPSRPKVFGQDPVHEQGTVENYWVSILELARLRRLERRAVGRFMLSRMEKAVHQGRSYGLYHLGPNTGVLLFSTASNKDDRRIELANLCAFAYCARNLRKIIGIATEPMDVEERSWDMIALEDEVFDDADELARIGNKLFGPEQRVKESEYPAQDTEKGTDPE